MRRAMGDRQGRAVALASSFGFVSLSCSFSALTMTRALLAKGAGFIPSMALPLASTKLVIELGIVISVFLGSQFVVAEYLGGVLLILGMWALVAVTRSRGLIARARE